MSSVKKRRQVYRGLDGLVPRTHQEAEAFCVAERVRTELLTGALSMRNGATNGHHDLSGGLLSGQSLFSLAGYDNEGAKYKALAKRIKRAKG